MRLRGTVGGPADCCGGPGRDLRLGPTADTTGIHRSTMRGLTDSRSMSFCGTIGRSSLRWGASHSPGCPCIGRLLVSVAVSSGPDGVLLWPDGPRGEAVFDGGGTTTMATPSRGRHLDLLVGRGRGRHLAGTCRNFALLPGPLLASVWWVIVDDVPPGRLILLGQLAAVTLLGLLSTVVAFLGLLSTVMAFLGLLVAVWVHTTLVAGEKGRLKWRVVWNAM